MSRPLGRVAALAPTVRHVVAILVAVLLGPGAMVVWAVPPEAGGARLVTPSPASPALIASTPTARVPQETGSRHGETDDGSKRVWLNRCLPSVLCLLAGSVVVCLAVWLCRSMRKVGPRRQSESGDQVRSSPEIDPRNWLAVKFGAWVIVVLLFLIAAAVTGWVFRPEAGQTSEGYAVTLFTLVALLMAIVGVGNFLWIRNEVAQGRQENLQWQENVEKRIKNEVAQGRQENLQWQQRVEERIRNEVKRDLWKEVERAQRDLLIALRSVQAPDEPPRGDHHGD